MRKTFIAFLAAASLLMSCNKGGGTEQASNEATQQAQAAQQAAAQAAQQAAQAGHQAAQQQMQPQASPEEQAKTDKGIIEKFVADNKLSAKSTASGIHYVIEKAGAGKQPTADSEVEVHYRGTLLDGTEFDSSYGRNQTAKFPLKGVIQGWQEAIPLLKEGGKGKFIIPSGLAYGPRQVGGKIPANSVLVFDVELIKIVK